MVSPVQPVRRTRTEPTRIEVATTRRALLSDAGQAALAQGHMPAERVYGLLFD